MVLGDLDGQPFAGSQRELWEHYYAFLPGLAFDQVEIAIGEEGRELRQLLPFDLIVFPGEKANAVYSVIQV